MSAEIQNKIKKVNGVLKSFFENVDEDYNGFRFINVDDVDIEVLSEAIVESLEGDLINENQS